MRVTGTIWALDLASSTGFAVGASGEVAPRSGAMLLKGSGEPREVAFGLLMEWLGAEWMKATPALVVKEAPLPLQGFKNTANSQATVTLTYGLHAIVEGLAQRFRIPCEQVYPATVRAHFIGKARTGTRAETKRAVIQRCHVLGLMPRDCHDPDRADALSIWDFACATHGGRAADILHMFGERAA